tara:strand:+ start:463 stop:963 length:501 start_codon:yes stop_codon:yes gene_type:complete
MKKIKNKTIFLRDLLKFFFYILIILYIFTGLYNERYFKIYPTLYLYPNNYKEINIVKQYINISQNNQTILDFIKLTDESVAHAFVQHINENIEELHNYEREIVLYILFFKYLFNRARPKQIDKSVNIFNSISANTPAFPSGHSMQGLYLAKKLSKNIQKKKNCFIN